MEKTGGKKRLKTQHFDPLAELPPNAEESKQQTVIIQFRDSEDQDVGFEISVDAVTSK